MAAMNSHESPQELWMWHITWLRRQPFRNRIWHILTISSRKISVKRIECRPHDGGFYAHGCKIQSPPKISCKRLPGWIYSRVNQIVGSSGRKSISGATNNSSKYVIICPHGEIPSGKRLHSYGKSPFWIGKSAINGVFSIAMLNYQRVIMFSPISPLHEQEWGFNPELSSGLFIRGPWRNLSALGYTTTTASRAVSSFCPIQTAIELV